MENEILETITLKKESPVEIEFLDDSVKLKFSDDLIILTSLHNQDCCERVYADFEYMKPYIPQLNEKYKGLIIKGVKEIGLLLCFECEYGSRSEKVLIPCYNEQNGYYSENLELLINNNGIEKRINIENYKEDNID